MKLAQALQSRADTQKRIDQLRVRLTNNATMQEGEPPAEDPRELLTELDGCIAELETWIRRINRTNAGTKIGDETLTDRIARRDCLRLRVEALRDFINNASQLTSRMRRSEILVSPSVPVKELQKESDALSKELRALDMEIQEMNWTTELL